MINKINILGIDYGIELSSVLAEEEGASGMCHPDNTLIEISDHLSPSMQKATVMHEIIEAIVARLDIEIDHHYIELLEAGVTSVILNNPELIKWMQNE